MTVNNAHAYCDESGNTGANLLDPIQPLFVVGGWFVLDNLKEAADEVVKVATPFTASVTVKVQVSPVPPRFSIFASTVVAPVRFTGVVPSLSTKVNVNTVPMSPT